jgi:hypothetical protein
MKFIKNIRDTLTKHFPDLSIQTVSAALGGLIALLVGTYILNKCSNVLKDESSLDKPKISQSFPAQTLPINKPVSSPIKPSNYEPVEPSGIPEDLKPNKSFVIFQIKKTLEVLRDLIKTSNFKYINGYAGEKNKYITIVSYDLCFKISYAEAKRRINIGDLIIKKDQLPKEKQKALKEYEIDELNMEVLRVLKDTYGDWKTNETFTITGKFTFLKTERGWLYNENEVELMDVEKASMKTGKE